MRLINIKKAEQVSWPSLWIVSAIASFSYVLMEWAFFATKTSFMTALKLYDKLKVLIIAPLPLLVISSAVIFLTWNASRFLSKKSGGFLLYYGARIIPSFIFAAVFFLILDNFTYTVFHFGVKSGFGSLKYVYFFVFIFLLFFGFRLSAGLEKKLSSRESLQIGGFSIAAFMLVSVLYMVISADFSSLVTSGAVQASIRQKKFPNILLLMSDGLSADNLSLYGYARKTTPFISKYIKGKALFCENAFPNAANTAGSTASILSGKLPTQTRLYYPPEILRGKDAYEHLPGILRAYGYKNVDISVRQFADAYDLNMRNSFDSANDRKSPHMSSQTWLITLLGQNTNYFLEQTFERFGNRLMYCLGIIDFVDSFDNVTGEKISESFSDEVQIERFFSFIQANKEPFFTHLHLFGTHGEKFVPRKRIFSKGKDQPEVFMRDFYDDAILDFDRRVEEIINKLEAIGKLKDTIIVIGTDHGMRFQSGIRIPLLFLFPGDNPAGRISTNAQNLDIAPTLLDYLGIPKPAWMRGESLLKSSPDRYRPIFSGEVNPYIISYGVWKVDESKNLPPFYSLGIVNVTVCDTNYRLDLSKKEITVSVIKNHTDPCPDHETLSLSEIKSLIAAHLKENGYDVSSLAQNIEFGMKTGN